MYKVAPAFFFFLKKKKSFKVWFYFWLFAASPLLRLGLKFYSVKRDQQVFNLQVNLPPLFLMLFLLIFCCLRLFSLFWFMLDPRSKTLSSFSKDADLKLKPLLTNKPLLIFQPPQLHFCTPLSLFSFTKYDNCGLYFESY